MMLWMLNLLAISRDKRSVWPVQVLCMPPFRFSLSQTEYSMLDKGDELRVSAIKILNGSTRLSHTEMSTSQKD